MAGKRKSCYWQHRTIKKKGSVDGYLRLYEGLLNPDKANTPLHPDKADKGNLAFNL